MRNRILFAERGSHEDRRGTRAERRRVVRRSRGSRADQGHADRVPNGPSQAWRARKAANVSCIFNQILLVPHSSTAAATPTLREVWIYFPDQSIDLNRSARAALARSVALSRADPAMQIVIGGVASQAGSISHGMRLALRRVVSISTYLLQQGVEPDRIEVAVRGRGWRVAEHSGGSNDPGSGGSECRLQVADSHWVLERS